jgi:hypothetical protein
VTIGSVRGKTDGRGEFRVDGVAPGDVMLRVDAGGRSVTDRVDVRGGDESRVELRIGR